MNVRLLYFASLADQAGRAEESVETSANNPATLYDEVRQRHGFSLDTGRLRVAVNGQIVDWTHGINEGDEIVFLPPVSGG